MGSAHALGHGALGSGCAAGPRTRRSIRQPSRRMEAGSPGGPWTARFFAGMPPSLSALGDPLEGPARYQVSVAVGAEIHRWSPPGPTSGSGRHWGPGFRSVVRTIDARKAWVAALRLQPRWEDACVRLTRWKHRAHGDGTWDRDTSAWLAEELGGVYALGRRFAFLASGTFLGHVLLWDPKTGEQMRDINMNAGVPGVEFSPDDRVIAVGTEGGTTSFFDVQGEQQIGQPDRRPARLGEAPELHPRWNVVAAGHEVPSILLYSDRAWTDDADALTADLCTIVKPHPRRVGGVRAVRPLSRHVRGD